MKRFKDVLMAIWPAVMLVWRSDRRWQILFYLAVSAGLSISGVLTSRSGGGVGDAQINGFLSGLFFGYAVFLTIEVYFEKKRDADFEAWAAKHVGQALSAELESRGFIGHVTVSEAPPTAPGKLN